MLEARYHQGSVQVISSMQFSQSSDEIFLTEVEPYNLAFDAKASSFAHEKLRVISSRYANAKVMAL